MAYIADSDSRTHRIELESSGESTTVRIDGEAVAIESRRIRNSTYSILVGGRSYVADVAADNDGYVVSVGCESFRISVADERRRRAAAATGKKEASGRREVRAMMPGKVVDVLVSAGARVEANQGLLIVEAMKMENEIRSPVAGEIKSVQVTTGQTVKTGDLLIIVE